MTGAERTVVDPSASPSGSGDGPRRVGRYELRGELAKGGMGTVFFGFARGMAGFERRVAIKCLHPHLAADPAFVQRFLDEARLAARIHHPNVVATIDVGQQEDLLYLVMEYVDGTALSEVCDEAAQLQRWLSPEMAVRIAIDMLQGLHAAHELRDRDGRPLELVHRDISPQNILVGIDGISRIVDFGIAKAKAQAAVTDPSRIKGKPAYLAPEQLSGGTVTRRADIWAAGVVLWELLTASRLFRGETRSEIMAKVLHTPVAAPSRLRSGVEPLDHVIARALARDPEQRYETAAEFAAALEQAGVDPAPARVTGEYVQLVLGPALRQRRHAFETTASTLAGPSPDSTGSHPRSSVGSSGRSDDAAAVASGQPSSRTVPSARTWAAVAALLIAAAALALVWWGRWPSGKASSGSDGRAAEAPQHPGAPGMGGAEADGEAGDDGSASDGSRSLAAAAGGRPDAGAPGASTPTASADARPAQPVRRRPKRSRHEGRAGAARRGGRGERPSSSSPGAVAGEGPDGGSGGAEFHPESI